MERWLLMIAILVIALLAKNTSLVMACCFILGLMVLPFGSRLFPWLAQNGMRTGVTIILITILLPIANGSLTFKDLISAFRSPLGWVAILCGILVAILSANGVEFIHENPMITMALTLGTIIGVVFFKGVAAGPIIAAGMTYYLTSLVAGLLGKF